MAIESVAARLTEAFALVWTRPRWCVQPRTSTAGFDGSPIRDSVPLLVESAARRELAAAGRRTLSGQRS